MLHYITYYILYFLVISNNLKRDSTVIQQKKRYEKKSIFVTYTCFIRFDLFRQFFVQRKETLWTFDICRLEVPLYATIPGKMKFAIRRKLINTRVVSDSSSFHL